MMAPMLVTMLMHLDTVDSCVQLDMLIVPTIICLMILMIWFLVVSNELTTLYNTYFLIGRLNIIES